MDGGLLSGISLWETMHSSSAPGQGVLPGDADTIGPVATCFDHYLQVCHHLLVPNKWIVVTAANKTREMCRGFQGPESSGENGRAGCPDLGEAGNFPWQVCIPRETVRSKQVVEFPSGPE